MSEGGISLEQQVSQEPKEGRVNAVLGTLKKNRNVQVDIATTGIGAGLAAALGAPETAPLMAGVGGFLGSFARIGYNLWDESGRRSQAVRGEAVDRTEADNRHLVEVIVDAVRKRTTQMPNNDQMNPDLIREDRARYFKDH